MSNHSCNIDSLNRNRKLQTSKARLKSQAQGTSLFTSAASNQTGFPIVRGRLRSGCQRVRECVKSEGFEHWLVSGKQITVRPTFPPGLVLTCSWMHKMCSDERKCAVMKGCLCSDELRKK